MSLKFSTILVKVSLALLTLHQTNGQQTQNLQVFWDTTNCNNHLVANTTESGEYPIEPGANYLSYRPNGLWVIEICTNATSCGILSAYQGDGFGCGFIFMGEDNDYTLVKLTRLGDPYQNETKIHFFPLPDFQGIPNVIDEDGANFPTILARSWFFTGMNQWEYKYDANSGSGTCLNHSRSVGENGYGVTYSYSTNWQIGSVQHGCTPPPTTTTTTTTPLPTTTTTTPPPTTTTKTPLPTTTTTTTPRPTPSTRTPRPSPTTRTPRPSPTTRTPRPSPSTRTPRPSPSTRTPRPSRSTRTPSTTPSPNTTTTTITTTTRKSSSTQVFQSFALIPVSTFLFLVLLHNQFF